MLLLKMQFLILLCHIVYGYEIEVFTEQNLTSCQEALVNENQKLYRKDSLFVRLQPKVKESNQTTFEFVLVDSPTNFTYLNEDALINETIYIKLQDHIFELCSLYTNSTTFLQFISCIKGNDQQGTPSLDLAQEQISINLTVNANSQYSSLTYYENQYYVLCLNSNSYHILAFNRNNNQIQKYDLNVKMEQINSCLIKYSVFQDHIIYSILYCEDWSVHKIDKEGKTILLLNQWILSQDSINLDSVRLLINMKAQYNKIILMFSESIYVLIGDNFILHDFNFWSSIKQLELSNIDTKLKLSKLTESFLNIYNQQKSTSIIEGYVKYYLNSTQKKLYFLEFQQFSDRVFILRINNETVVLFYNFLEQIIEINFFQIIFGNNYFFGLRNNNNFVIFQQNYSNFYYTSKYFTQHEYVVQFRQATYDRLVYTNCFLINHNNFTDQQLSVYINHSNLRSLFFVIDAQQAEIMILKQVFQTNLPTQVEIEQPLENCSMSDQKFFYIICPISQYFSNYQGTKRLFFYRGKNQTLIIFDCEQQQQYQITAHNIALNYDKLRQSYQQLYILDKSGLQLFLFDQDLNQPLSLTLNLIYEFDKEMFFSKGPLISKNSYILLQAKNYSLGEDFYVIQTGSFFHNDVKKLDFPKNQKKLEKIENFVFFSIQIFFIQYTDSIEFINHNQPVQSNQIIFLVLNKKVDILTSACQFRANYKMDCLVTAISYDISQLQLYFVSAEDFTILTVYDFLDYIPIKNSKYAKRFQNDQFLIVAKKANSSSFYFHLFDIINAKIVLLNIIESGKDFFQFTEDYIIYYDMNNQLITYDYDYYTIQTHQIDTTKLTQKNLINLKFTTLTKEIQTYSMNFSFSVIYDDSRISQKQIDRHQVDFLNNKAQFSVRNYLNGAIQNINILNSQKFSISSPIKVIQNIRCQFYFDKYCFSLGKDKFILLNLSNFTEYEFYSPFVAQIIFIERYQRNPDKYLIIYHFMSYNVTAEFYEVYDNQLTLICSQQIELIQAEQPLKIQVIQNILFVRNWYHSQSLHLIAENSLVSIRQNFSISKLIYLQNNTYASFYHEIQNIEAKLFRLNYDELIIIQSVNITSKEIEQYIFDQYQLPLLLNLIDLAIIQFETTQYYQQIPFRLAILDKTFGVFTMNFAFYNGFQKITNIKRKHYLNNQSSSVVFIINENYLVLKNYDVSVYSASDDLEQTDPLFINKTVALDVIYLNTTHFILAQKTEQYYDIDIATIQEWELLHQDIEEQNFIQTLKIEVQGSLQDQVVFQLTVLQSRNGQINLKQLALVCFCFIFIIIVIYLRRRSNILQKAVAMQVRINQEEKTIAF